MSLEIGTFPVADVVFGTETRWRDGVLELDHDELLALAKKDPLLRDSKLELVKHGESARVINHNDVIEPRAKVSGPGQVYPGDMGRSVVKTGAGRTHRISGIGVVECLDDAHLPRRGRMFRRDTIAEHPASWEHFFDLSGPGCSRPPYGLLHNLCLVTRAPDAVPVDESAGSVRLAVLRIADRLAQTVVDRDPAELETFDLTPRPGLPNVAYVPCIPSSEFSLGARSPVGSGIYGMTRLTYPWALDPTEVLDGAVGGTNTWLMVNNPVVLEACRAHGKEMNFKVCVVQRSNWTSQAEKELMAERLAHLLQLMDIQGAIITTDARGQRWVETILTADACERAGIKVVLLTEEEDNENGSAPPLLVSSPILKAAVSNGTGDVPTPFPAVDRVVGSWDQAGSSWYGELPPIHGRYGTKHFSDVYGSDCVSYADF